MRNSVRPLAAALSVLMVAAVTTIVVSQPAAAGAPTFTLQVLHASDLEGGVDAIDRADNFAALIDIFEDDPSVDGSITLSAGDNYIPGPFFSAAGDQATFRDSGLFNDVYNQHFGVTDYDALREGGGRVDISIMNIIGFHASAVGNHEFDSGSTVFGELLAPDFRDPAGPSGDRWVGAQFPYVSANLDTSGDAALSGLFTSDLLPNSDFVSGPAESTAGTDAPKIAPNTYIEVNGERIGVVGATTPLIQRISSPSGTTVIGPTTNDMPALAAVIQPAIDELTAIGINKIVLVTHLQQLSLEQELVPLLNEVDISIAGGSDTIMANPDDTLRPGDTAATGYPVITSNADGDPAVIVSTDGEYSYVGRLVVDFDNQGRISNPGSLDAALNGPVATTDANVTAAWGAGDPFAVGTKGELVRRLTDAVQGVVTAKDSVIAGETSVFLEGRRELVRTEETNLGDLSADANLAAARAYDATVAVSIKNGGGIRAEIGEIDNMGDVTTFLPPQANPLSGKLEGQVSQLDIENALRFNNELSILTLTAAELLEIIEHGVSAVAPDATPGQFPQVGGMTFSYDPSRPAGDRVMSLAIVDDAGNLVDTVARNGSVVGNPSRAIRVVTLNFLADGGDGYPFDTLGEGRVDLADVLTAPGALTFADPGTEQDAFAEYLAANHPVGGGTPYSMADTAPELDQRIQDLSARPDTVFASSFTGVRPVRVMDTRLGQIPALAAVDGNTVFTVQVGGTTAVPRNATAVALNVTATEAQGPGYVTVYPSGIERPLASNLNLVRAGQTLPNLVIVPLGADGKVSFYTQAGTELVADVLGYFTSARAATAGRIVTATPRRLFDTRTPAAPSGALGADATLDVAVLGQAGVPATGVSAVIMNVTATDSAAPGYVTVYPTGGTPPLASNLNLERAGQTAPNLVVVPVGADGKVSFYSQSGTHLLGDVVGYVTATGSTASTAGLMVPLTPARVFDTRTPTPPTGVLPPDGSIDVTFAGVAGVADDATGVVGNVTVTEAAGPGFVTVWDTGATRPLASTLNLSDVGETRPNAIVSRLGTGGRLSFYAQSGGHLLADVSGYLTR